MKKLLTLIMIALATNAIVGQNTWVSKASFGGTARQEAAGFSIGTTGYILTGNDGTLKKDVWAWDQSTNIWSPKNNFPGTARKAASAVSHGGKGYLFCGTTTTVITEVWEYSPGTDSWIQKNNFPGIPRKYATVVSNGTNIYLIGGDKGSLPYLSDIWEYTPLTDTWVQKTSFPGGQRSGGVAFAIGSKIYFGTGNDNSTNVATNDLWEYDPGANSWTAKASIPTSTTTVSLRRTAAAFVINNLGYIGLGWHGASTYNYDFWEYDDVANTWTQRLNFMGTGANTPVGFSIGNKGYFGTGGTASGYTSQFWEYSPVNTQGVNELGANNGLVNLFPNPNNGSFNLEIANKIENAELILINCLGQKVYEQTVRQGLNDVNTNNLPSGLYNYILLLDKQKILNGKLIVD